MSGISDLNILLGSMSPQLDDDLYVFCSVAQQVDLGPVVPRMSFVEAEGRTLILRKHEAESLNLEFSYCCRMITLSVNSSLDAVGFMAAITSELASAGISVNPVSGFYHDHLLVPDGSEKNALRVLDKLSSRSDRP